MDDLGVSLTDVIGGSASLEAIGPTARAALDMLEQAYRAIDVDSRQARVFIDQASRLLAPISGPPPAPEEAVPAAGLAVWQKLAISQYIEENLSRPISTGELAKIVGFSVNYFSRCFKDSFGVSPRSYVIERRLERAKALMAETDASLCQIALESGFCDQAHMTRIFQQFAGGTPGSWRRSQVTSLAA